MCLDLGGRLYLYRGAEADRFYIVVQYAFPRDMGDVRACLFLTEELKTSWCRSKYPREKERKLYALK